MYLSKIKIKNFRCLGSVELDLKPITVIFGPNGSGKSSILAAIQLLKQSVEQERLTTNQPIDVGTFNSFVKDADATKWVTVGLELSFEEDEFLSRAIFSDRNAYMKFANYVGEISPPIKNAGYEASFRENKGALELEQTVKINGITFLKTRISQEKGRTRTELLIPRIKAQPNTPSRILYESMGYINFSQPHEDKRNIRKLYGELVKDLVRMFKNLLNNYFVIGPTRATEPFKTTIPTDPKWVGHKGEDVTGVLSKIWGNAALSEKRLKISKWAEIFGLTNLWAGFQGGTELGVTFNDPKSGAPVHLNWAGHGSKQMLILITQMFLGDEEEVVAVEEPEISLHLKLQMELPRLFAEVVREKKQIIVTSHSSQFLTAFRRSFKKRKLTTKDLAVYHLRKTEKGATIEKLKVTKQGMVTPFIPSIADAEKKLVSEAFK